MTKKYIVINDPIVDIIAISRAKKRAAQKLNIPFSIGDEIYASDLLNQKEFHTHVDLTNEHGYKKQKFNLNGQLLHAGKLSFIHPSTNDRVEFFAKLPDYFSNVLKKLKKD